MKLTNRKRAVYVRPQFAWAYLGDESPIATSLPVDDDDDDDDEGVGEDDAHVRGMVDGIDSPVGGKSLWDDVW